MCLIFPNIPGVPVIVNQPATKTATACGHVCLYQDLTDLVY